MQRALNKELREYLSCPAEQDEEKMPEIDSARKVYEVMKQVKIIVRHLQTETEERLRTTYSLQPKAAGGASEAGEAKHGGDGGHAGGDASGMVGDLDATGGGGFGLGTAPAHARPPTSSGPTRGGAPATGSVGLGSPSRQRAGGGSAVGFSEDAGGKEDDGTTFYDRDSAYRQYVAGRVAHWVCRCVGVWCVGCGVCVRVGTEHKQLI